jgi:hypothetical protein
MVSLWDLLTFLSGACAFAGALAAARLEGGGPLKLAIGVFLGLLLGFSSFYLVGIAGSRVGLPIQTTGQKTRSSRWLPLAYFAKMAWPFLVTVLAMKITQGVIHLIHS